MNDCSYYIITSYNINYNYNNILQTNNYSSNEVYYVVSLKLYVEFKQSAVTKLVRLN